MENTINRLLGILNKYSINEVNKIYRDKEVELETSLLTAFPDVKWSENMQKKILQQAKRKKISEGRRKYIIEQIEDLNNYKIEEHVNQGVDDIINMFKKLNNSSINKDSIRIIHIEFSGNNDKAYISIFGEYQDEWYENGLGGFEHAFHSANYWAEINSKKFYSMSELLEIIEIENEEYPGIFLQIRELRVFNCLKQAIGNSSIINTINKELTKIKIQVCIHDDTIYTIFEN